MPALCTLSSLRGLLHRSGPLITAARATPCAFEESRVGVARRDSHGWPPIVAGGAPHVRAFFSRGEPQQPFLARLAAVDRVIRHLPIPGPAPSSSHFRPPPTSRPTGNTEAQYTA